MFLTALPKSLNLADWGWTPAAEDAHGRRTWVRWQIPFRHPAVIGEVSRHPAGVMVWYDHPRHGGVPERSQGDATELLAEICLNLPAAIHTPTPAP